jgi:hypothetical protein
VTASTINALRVNGAANGVKTTSCVQPQAGSAPPAVGVAKSAPSKTESISAIARTVSVGGGSSVSLILTQPQYEAMLANQGNGCAICGRAPEGSYPGMLHVDHCHETGRIRGLLCQVCNLSLGKFQHNPALLRLAADYLET